jgi:arylsulfatase A-like enzyme/Tfp pilus assembly protein PilF
MMPGGRHLAGAGLLAVALPAMLSASCVFGGDSSQDFSALREGEPFNVLVITIDTIRADRIGAYGYDDVETPAMDALAREGVLFSKAYSTTPLTLPAHTTIFSGTYPLYHGVRDNGGYVVPEDLTTMAELFAEQGYDTAAFIAAYVLDSRWGLNQGFDTYFDDFDVRDQRFISMGSVQRPANEVIDETAAWLDEGRDDPFFLWVHLYDPHAPYEPPEPYLSQYAGSRYAGEIAFTDSQIDRLLGALEERGLRDNTFIVLAGDHGESLGEHGEGQHGFFIYEGATHVPLIIWTPFEKFGGIERGEVVSLVDIMPTVLEMCGLETPEHVQGASLVPYFSSAFAPDPRYVYSETFYPRLHYGWSELTSIQDEQYKLIMSPEPELYDLVEDPEETTNLAEERRAIFGQLRDDAEELVARLSEEESQAAFMDVDEETMKKLASLGYIGSFQISSEGPAESLPSPREKIGIYNKSIDARHAMQVEHYDEAESLFSEILAEDPGVLAAYQGLAQLYTLEERFAEAVEVRRTAIPLKPDDPLGYVHLAEAQISLGDLDAAKATALGALDIVAPHPQILFLLGDISRKQEDYSLAIEYFGDVISLNPESSGAYAGLGAVYFLTEQYEAAQENALEALAINERTQGAHFTVARVLEEKGDVRGAVREYQQELEVNAGHAGALFNLAMIHRVAEQPAEEENLLRQVLEIDPDHALANLFMARIYLGRNERYREAVDMVEGAIGEPLETDELVLGYFLLADLYNRLGDPRRANEYARRGQSLMSQRR